AAGAAAPCASAHTTDGGTTTARMAAIDTRRWRMESFPLSGTVTVTITRPALRAIAVLRLGRAAGRRGANEKRRGSGPRRFVMSRLSRMGRPGRASAPVLDRHEVALGRTGVELTGTADLLGRIADHLLPLGDPADRAGQREQHREHRGREAHRRQGNARIEV